MQPKTLLKHALLIVTIVVASPALAEVNYYPEPPYTYIPYDDNGITRTPSFGPFYVGQEFSFTCNWTLRIFKVPGNIEVAGGGCGGIVNFTATEVGTYEVRTNPFNAFSPLGLLKFSFDVVDGSSPTPSPTPSATSVPASAPASATSSGPNTGTINVVKTVINDNGRTKVVSDFPLFVNGKLVISGQTNTFPAPASRYDVTESADPNYISAFSGDCDSNGGVNLNPGENKFCIITNDDIGIPAIVPPVPPLIDVVKVPNPLALPDGPGPVSYTYTLRNIGTVPVTDITMVGDTCSPIVLVSGDTNSDLRLDVNETWVHRCTTTLNQTTTNTVTATGWANGISAVDVASATVVVTNFVPGLPNAGVRVVPIPPLIHVTKIPNPLTLPAEGGTVTYTNIVTNPGAVALSNIHLADDKCSPVKYISGDMNRNLRLDTNEKWTYTCQAKLVETTTNTITARGELNGLIAKDLAIVTVVVAAYVPVKVAPTLPDTGTSFYGQYIFFNILLLILVIIILILLCENRKSNLFVSLKAWFNRLGR